MNSRPGSVVDSRGYITSTPKSTTFSKKTRFWTKNERASCIPQPKNGERPYLAVPEPTFWGAIFGLFYQLSVPIHPDVSPPHTPRPYSHVSI